ncbi:MAG TPA: hypothetical protein QGF05_02050, partial [Dehalococcoidia bacterium]|nr:hypothetical protein [Dehalococcoidia bacterium]
MRLWVFLVLLIGIPIVAACGGNQTGDPSSATASESAAPREDESTGASGAVEETPGDEGEIAEAQSEESAQEDLAEPEDPEVSQDGQASDAGPDLSGLKDPDPLNLTVETADELRVSSLVTTAGGTLSTTDRDGTTYTLIVPPGAVQGETEMAITPLSQIVGLPPTKRGAACSWSPMVSFSWAAPSCGS